MENCVNYQNKKYCLLTEDELRKKITVISFISAISVVLIHAYYVYHNSPAEYDVNMQMANKIAYFFNWLGHQYAVQIFFILSGFLLFRNMSRNSLIRKIKSRIFSLVVPYILWNIFYILFWIIASGLGWSDVVVNLNPVSLVKAIVTHQYFSTYWFMGNLIIYVAISPILYFLSRKKIVLLITNIGFLVVQFLISLNVIKWNIGNQGLFFTDWFLYFLCGVNIAIFLPDLFKVQLYLKYQNLVVWGGYFALCVVNKIVRWNLAVRIDNSVYHNFFSHNRMLQWNTMG